MIEIEKGVPLPRDSRGYHRVKYPWYEMEVGDSFVITNVAQRTAETTVCAHNKKHPETRFIQRKQPDGSHRVWRVK